MKKEILPIFLLISVCSLLMFSCSSENGPGHHHGVLETIREHSNSKVEYEVSSQDHLEGLKKVLVNLENDSSFFVPERISNIKSFPCTNCHSKQLSELEVDEKDFHKKAHWNIEFVHADKATMDCLTCHNEENLDELSTLTGQKISFNESYDLCGQCHSSQKKDWLGGAHGKRLGGWAPPRVSNSCVNCHNPHNPAFQPRWPARHNTTKILQQDKN